MMKNEIVFEKQIQKMKHKIIIGDCRDVMKSIPDNSIDMIITSPPYNIGKDYKVFKENLSIKEYIKFTEQWIKESYRVLRNNGHLCLNLSVTDKINVDELHSRLLKINGFTIKEKIIWVKSKYTKIDFLINSKNRFSYNTHGRLAMCYESILVFTKSNYIPYSNSSKGIPESWKYNVWFIPPVKERRHPAPFPKEIPKRLIQMYSRNGDTILDPFSGTGTTIKVASEHGRNSIGIELNPEYVEIAKRRLNSNRKFIRRNENG